MKNSQSPYDDSAQLPDFYLLRGRLALLAWEEWLEVQRRDVLLLSVGECFGIKTADPETLSYLENMVARDGVGTF